MQGLGLMEEQRLDYARTKFAGIKGLGLGKEEQRLAYARTRLRYASIWINGRRKTRLCKDKVKVCKDLG